MSETRHLEVTIDGLVEYVPTTGRSKLARLISSSFTWAGRDINLQWDFQQTRYVTFCHEVSHLPQWREFGTWGFLWRYVLRPKFRRAVEKEADERAERIKAGKDNRVKIPRKTQNHFAQ